MAENGVVPFRPPIPAPRSDAGPEPEPPRNRAIRVMLARGPKPPPRWLTACHRFADLPRVSSTPLPHRAAFPRASLAQDLPLQMLWIVERGHGAWAIDTQGFTFEDSATCAAYRAAFGPRSSGTVVALRDQTKNKP